MYYGFFSDFAGVPDPTGLPGAWRVVRLIRGCRACGLICWSRACLPRVPTSGWTDARPVETASGRVRRKSLARNQSLTRCTRRVRLARPLSLEAGEDQSLAAEGRRLSNIPMLAGCRQVRPKTSLPRHHELIICGLHLRLMRMGGGPTLHPSQGPAGFDWRGFFVFTLLDGSSGNR